MLTSFRWLFAAPDETREQMPRDVARFGIGFCPGCKRLRGAASLRCEYCGNAAAVTPDA
jgi:hypothetical protein